MEYHSVLNSNKSISIILISVNEMDYFVNFVKIVKIVKFVKCLKIHVLKIIMIIFHILDKYINFCTFIFIFNSHILIIILMILIKFRILNFKNDVLKQ
jgi:hypothetical protein